MKRGFTMIELIFVIVILGILAAVALPKFMKVSTQAHEANLKSFIGTLNGTTGPSLWSSSIANGHDGNVSHLDLEYVKNTSDDNLTTYIDMPKEIKDMNLSKCSTDYEVIGHADKGYAGADYNITCKDGNANHAPAFRLVQNGTVLAGPNK